MWLTLPQRLWLSLPELTHVSVHTYFFFPPKTHFPCFTTFCPYVEILFYRALLLVNFPDDLVARIQHSRCRCPTSNSGHQPKSCLKQQAKATQNQFPINNWTIQAWLQDGESLHWYLIYKKCAIFFFFFLSLTFKTQNVLNSDVADTPEIHRNEVWQQKVNQIRSPKMLGNNCF